MQISMTRSEAMWGNRYLLFQLFFLPSLVSLALSAFFPGVTALQLNLICWAVNFCAVCFIFRNFLLDSMENAFLNIKRILSTATIGFLIYWVANLALTILLLTLLPDFFNVNNANLETVAQENLLLTSLGTVVLVPIVEEVFYRGLVFGLLRRRNAIAAYVVSTAAFCAIHVMGYIGYYAPLHLLICTVQYIPAGVVLAACYHRSGNILTPTLIHMAVNAIAMLSMR